jgi:hypothetical protein
MQEWVRTAVVSGGSLVVGALLNQALVIWRDDRQRRRELELKRRERQIEQVQSLTEALAAGLDALDEYVMAEHMGISKTAGKRVADAQAKLNHASVMGLPLELHQPLQRAAGEIWSFIDEGGGTADGARDAMKAACDAVAKYLRES